MPDASADGTINNDAREVGPHEFGHFFLLNLLQDSNSNAIDNLVGDSILSPATFNSYTYSTRYVNEAFADYISGQVTGIANYGWLDSRQAPFGKYCLSSPCYDENLNAPPPVGESMNTNAIARDATLIHDAFDGHGLPRNVSPPVPNDADPWIAVDAGIGVPAQYEFTTVPYGNFDGTKFPGSLAPACREGTGPQSAADGGAAGDGGDAGSPDASGFPACIAGESVALSGADLVSFGHELGRISFGMPYLQDQNVAQALDTVMVGEGYNWCQRCQVLALHVPENGDPTVPLGTGDTLDPISLLNLCYRANAAPILETLRTRGAAASLSAWQLPSVPAGSAAPDPNLRLDAFTCATCPPNESPDVNGVCTNQCPADFVIDGLTQPLMPATTGETTSSALQPGTDPCPGLFVLEIDSPDAFFTHGAVEIEGSLSVDMPSQQSCVQPFSLSLAESVGSGFMSVQQSNTTGSFSPGGLAGGLGFPASCQNLPQPIVLMTGQVMAAPIRFITPALVGVSFTLATPPTPPLSN
jgi:hypothetical protein